MKKIILITMLVTTGWRVSAQSPYWALAPSLYKTATGAISSLQGNYTTPCSVSATGYDGNGNLLYTIVDQKIFNTAGTLIGNLTPGFTQSGKNIIIVKDPGNCNAQLVFHTTGTLIVGSGCYHISQVHCTRLVISGSNITVQQNYPQGPSLASISNCNLYSGMAITRPKANGTRYLYVVSDISISKFVVSASGITHVANFNIGSGNMPTDVELSLFEDRLAWSDANINNGLRWVMLDNNGNVQGAAGSWYTNAYGYRTYGLEFISNNKVLVSAATGSNGGFYTVDLPTGNFTQVVNNASYAYSQLEKITSGGGRIFAAKGSGLLAIDIYTFGTTAINMPIATNGSYQVASYYAMCNQLDRENYSQIFSCSPITVCPIGVSIKDVYTTKLTQARESIRNDGGTFIPAGEEVVLDVHPEDGFIELSEGFETEDGASFEAQAAVGCDVAGEEPPPGKIPLPVVPDEHQQRIMAYPNPVTNKLVVQHGKGASSLQVWNSLGILVLSQRVQNTSTTELDLRKQPPGVYFLRVNGKMVQQFIKQ